LMAAKDFPLKKTRISSHQEDITIVNIYVSKFGMLSFLK
jgi:hypothetical protein